MKYIGVIAVILAILGFLGWQEEIYKKMDWEYESSEKIKKTYTLPNHPAPSNLKEYPPKGGVNLGEGLYYLTLKEGESDELVDFYDLVEVKYTGWNFTTGEMFDTSDRVVNPFAVMVGSEGVIKGWQEVLPHLSLGQKVRVWIPEHMAYPGSKRQATQGMLVFDMEIVSHKKAPFEEDISEYPIIPPKKLKATATGIKSLVLDEGEGKSPEADSRVVIYDSKWSDKGEVIRSTRQLQRKLELDLSITLPGVREAIQMMKVGEKRRFWIPKELLYGDNPPANYPPTGWIWDVELLEVKEK